MTLNEIKKEIREEQEYYQSLEYVLKNHRRTNRKNNVILRKVYILIQKTEVDNARDYL
ncbi:MAG: hypothetical protein ACRCZ2_08680 [Fusobacteriaceae bacterium]